MSLRYCCAGPIHLHGGLKSNRLNHLRTCAEDWRELLFPHFHRVQAVRVMGSRKDFTTLFWVLEGFLPQLEVLELCSGWSPTGPVHWNPNVLTPFRLNTLGLRGVQVPPELGCYRSIRHLSLSYIVTLLPLSIPELLSMLQECDALETLSLISPSVDWSEEHHPPSPLPIVELPYLHTLSLQLYPLNAVFLLTQLSIPATAHLDLTYTVASIYALPPLFPKNRDRFLHSSGIRSLTYRSYCTRIETDKLKIQFRCNFIGIESLLTQILDQLDKPSSLLELQLVLHPKVSFDADQWYEVLKRTPSLRTLDLVVYAPDHKNLGTLPTGFCSVFSDLGTTNDARTTLCPALETLALGSYDFERNNEYEGFVSFLATRNEAGMRLKSLRIKDAVVLTTRQGSLARLRALVDEVEFL
jgi:hypothetical protein